jgi:hypothetical protein
VELRLRGLRDHVEAELEILLVGQTFMDTSIR